ncbi:hypothetical protein [Desulfoluna spongiiphila]|uniref:Uncharacterized protein n=1 Tax=Desulfoluna spongiiphila TaxID=419481 RepID=A0A1G5J2T4_9BACT|nr:hypothetical protein [Desulfoluna spongiiphila]SCY82281.1 hypothetical protein SAMN05216233_12416 [Desulfoluna spongiiphila]
METVACELPGGYVDDDGGIHREVVLGPLTGAQEKAMAQQGNASPAARVTWILASCIRRIGTLDEITEAHARHLLVGDRQFLLLKLREITFGHEMSAVTRCSRPDCGERLDIEFTTDTVPVVRAPQECRFMTLEFPLKPHKAEPVTFRLPNGEDQEHLAHLATENEALAATLLLARCVRSMGPQGDAPQSREKIKNLSEQARAQIEEAMERLAPKVVTTMEAFCPECKRHFSVAFDLQSFVLKELGTRLDLLFQEVHYLAFHYHWSEKEILGMTRADRRRYIGILSDAVEQNHHAG